MQLHEHVLHDISHEQVKLTLITDPIAGLKICQMAVIPQHIGAESVDRSNLGVVNKRRLAREVLVIRILFQSIRYGFSYSFAHLSRCSPRKCDDEKIINIHFILQYICHDPCNENRCFTASRGSADQYIVAAAVNYLLLVICPFHTVSPGINYCQTPRQP